MDVPEKQKTETQSIISSEILRQLHFPLQPIPDNKRCPSFCRVCGLCAQIKTHYLLPLLMLLYNDPIYRNLILPNIFFFLSREVVIQQKIKCTQFTSSFPLIPLLPFLTGNIRHSVIQVVKCLRTQHVFSSSAVVLPGEVTASGPYPAFSWLSLGRSCHQICQNRVPLTDVFVPTAELTGGFVRV